MRSLTPSVSSQGPRDSKGRFEDGWTMAGWSQQHCEALERQGWQEKASLTCFEVVSPAFCCMLSMGRQWLEGLHGKLVLVGEVHAGQVRKWKCRR